MLFNIKNFISLINRSSINFNLQSQIIFSTNLLIYILIIVITPWSIKILEKQINRKTIIFVNEINLLLKTNIISLDNKNNSSNIVSFLENFYENTNNIRYILFIDKDGISYGIPYNYNEILNLTKHDTDDSNKIRSRLNFILKDEFGISLLIATNLESNNLNNLFASSEVIILFLMPFLILIVLNLILNRLSITTNLNELLEAIKNIKKGYFSKRIKLNFKSDFKDLILNFNEMGRSLEIYEEKNKEQLLNEKKKLESLFATIADGTIFLDMNLKVVLLNTAALKILGLKTKTRFIGYYIWDCLPINLQKTMFLMLKKVLFQSTKVIFLSEFADEKIQISKRFVRISINIIYDSEDLYRIPLGIGLTLQDNTKELELNNTQNRFISNISHELRTPLFNIKSFIETIQEYDYSLSVWQKKYFLNIVNEETNRLTRLVNDILFVSKLDSLKINFLETIDLIGTINQALANYQLAARNKKIYLHSLISINKSTLKANKDLILQVLINLIGNALKFTHKNGEIIIRAYTIDQETCSKLRIEIADTGIGINESYLTDIFQRFYRIENDVHTLKGTGLGLSIVKNILREHYSTINVISRYNIGALFWFDLDL